MKGLKETPTPFYYIEELLTIVLMEMDEADFKNMAFVSKIWYSVILQITPIKRLHSVFHIPEYIVKQLKSPALVYERFNKIEKRRKVEIFNEYGLYKLYCNQRSIHTPFVRLLDDNTAWFEAFFSNKDTFFLECHFKQACMTGNTDLVQFFIEQKGLKPQENHVSLAASSGQLPLVKYLIEEQQCAVHTTGETSIFYETLISGNAALYEYIKERFKWQPNPQDFNTAVMSGSFELVQQLHKEYDFTAEKVTLLALEYSRNLNIFHYLVSILNWTPHVKGIIALTETVYSMGIPSIIEYARRMFTFDITKLKLLDNAIDSQNFKTFNDLCKELNITKDNIQNFISNSTMFKALNSGNIEIVRSLKETYCLPFESEHCLTYAIESGNPDLLDYAMNTKQFKISTKETSKACQFGSLDFISKLYQDGHEFLPADMGRHCSYDDNLIRLYHLIENEGYKPCEVLLFNVITNFKQYKDKNLFYHFMEYLISVHKLKPTMETIMAVNADKKMVAILYGKSENKDSQAFCLLL